MKWGRSRLARSFSLLASMTILLTGGAAAADPSACREWQSEHREWKARVLGAYLRGAPQQELDEGVFEILQREAYLTSCDSSVAGARREMIGWRLLGRSPGEYASAVAESVLAQGGFEVELRGWLPAREEIGFASGSRERRASR